MDQETAKQLFYNGATLLVFDMPEGSEFGIDYNSWTTGPKFKGIKMIPPGVHFVYYNATGKQGGRASRIGFFHFFNEREIIFRRYDPSTEDFTDERSSGDETENYRRNLCQLDQFLGAYPYENYKKWFSLSSEITDEDILRLQPLTGKVTSQSELISKETDVAGSSCQRVDRQNPVRQRFSDEQGLPIMRLKPGTEIRFSRIPLAKNDSTLNETISNLGSPFRILAELQLAFICFLMGHVYEGFEQWKRLVHFLCSGRNVLALQEDLYSRLLSVLFFQLKECPPDFFVDIVSRNNFLTITLSNLFCNIDSTPNVNRELVKKGKKFKNYLTKTFKWDFDSEPDDFKPVVVTD